MPAETNTQSNSTIADHTREILERRGKTLLHGPDSRWIESLSFHARWDLEVSGTYATCYQQPRQDNSQLLTFTIEAFIVYCEMTSKEEALIEVKDGIELRDRTQHNEGIEYQTITVETLIEHKQRYFTGSNTSEINMGFDFSSVDEAAIFNHCWNHFFVVWSTPVAYTALVYTCIH